MNLITYLSAILIACLSFSHQVCSIVTHDKVFSQSFLPPQNPKCYHQVERCELLNSSQCLDVTLPYKYTTIPSSFHDLVINDIHLYLSRWKVLRSIPQCWKVLQSILCASFFPRCDIENRRVMLPNYDMCKLTRSPCRLIEKHYKWPDFLSDCNNSNLFPNCPNEYTDLKFNSSETPKCHSPLVNSNDTNIWHNHIDGCALQCHNPIYSEDEHQKVSHFIKYAASISLIANLFAVATFIIDWKSSNRYPAVIIFYLNFCFLISDLGWLFQFFKSKDEIVCRSDNTARYSEPNSSEYMLCLMVFFLIYYFSMAILVWFVCLAYAWDLSYQKTPIKRNPVNSKVAYFHLSAWSIPLMLSITIYALGEIDGDSLRGICFVGFVKPVMRICFVLLPATVSLVIGCFYLLKAMKTLVQAKRMIKSLSKNKINKIKHMIIRIFIFATCAIGSVVCTYICHVYELINLPKWKQSLDEYILCSLNLSSALNPYSDLTKQMECRAKERPNLFFVYSQLTSLFGLAILTSTWVWTSTSFASWKRFIRRHLRPDLNEPLRLKKHEMISKVFNRRHQLSQGCYSPSFYSIHNDPVGMNLTSAASQDLSQTWAAALPNLIYRRGGITQTMNNTHYLPHFNGTRHSSVSDISQQRSFDSYASNHMSFESQINLEQELARHQKRKTKKEREKLLKAYKRSRILPYNLPMRRGSDTSGSLISSAFIGNGLLNGKQDTKATSTGDLMSMIQLPMVPFTPQFMPPPSSLASNYQPFVPPIVSPNFMPRQRTKMPKSAMSNFTFTHGMSDQSKTLMNPLHEKRRPDSSNSNHTQPTSPTRQAHNHLLASGNLIQQIGPFGGPNSYGNFGLTYMNGVNYPNPNLMNFFNGNNSMNPFFNNLMQNSMPNGHMQNFANFMPNGFATQPIPGVAFMPQQVQYQGVSPTIQQPDVQFENLQDLQEIIRERADFLPLVLPHDTASEISEFFPIQITDSESCAENGLASRNEDTQQMVEHHIQEVEAAAEKLADGKSKTVVGAMGQDLVGEAFEMQSLKNKSEKKKKKKSSKKYKQNKDKQTSPGPSK